ncbi:MAG: hypothetical protein LBH43_11305, partial [Treponema sp.]|nr:hypothetical protein [Treponema sp.]
MATFEIIAEESSAMLEKGGVLAILASPPVMGERISRILKEYAEKKQAVSKNTDGLLNILEQNEQLFFNNPEATWAWTGEMLEKAL